MVLPLPRTSISFGTGFAPCVLWHTGSASMASGLRAGAFPSKVTVPVMFERRQPTPGHSDIANSPAASHNRFPVPRMVGSLVIIIAVRLARVDAQSHSIIPALRRELLSAPAASNVLARLRARAHAGRYGEAGATHPDLTRSRTRAIRPASGRAAVRAPAVASASSPPPRSTRRRRRARPRPAPTDGVLRDGASA